MEYRDKNTGLIMYSSWWIKGKDFLKTNAIIISYRDRMAILEQKVLLWQNGWKEILPVTLKVKCECHIGECNCNCHKDNRCKFCEKCSLIHVGKQKD